MYLRYHKIKQNKIPNIQYKEPTKCWVNSKRVSSKNFAADSIFIKKNYLYYFDETTFFLNINLYNII